MSFRRHPVAVLIGAATMCLAAGHALASTTALPRLHAEAPYFKDEAGRVVLLRGVNVATDSKVPPFSIIDRPEQLDLLKAGGLNVLRLLFLWEPYEPVPGQYNQAYLDQYTRIIDWAQERGMYVIVNFHQDAFARNALKGCGDGFPLWALPAGIEPALPDNNLGCRNWGPMLVSDTNLKRTWDGFHADSGGVLTRYKTMVERVVGHLKGRSSVIGYDVLNEPGGTDAQISLLFRNIGSAIRAVDPDTVLFFVPPPLSSSGLSLDKIEDPKFSNAASGAHFYDPATIILRAWLGTPSAWYLNPMLKRAKDRNWTLLLGEFGAHGGTLFSKPYMGQLYDWLDENFVSSTQWGYNPRWTSVTKDGWNQEDLSIAANGAFRPEIFEPRAFPRITAGTPVSFKPTSRGFAYTWQHKPQLGDTIFHLPAPLRDPRFVKVSPASATCKIQASDLVCTSAQPGNITVNVNR